MATKKSPAELKKEGVELGAVIAAARKRTHNFAILLGKEGLVLETDIRKPPEALWRMAKKVGGGSKGAMGTMNVKGKIVELTCLADDPPTSLVRLGKEFFAERGLALKLALILPGDAADDSATDDTAEDEKQRKALVSGFKALSNDLKEAMKNAGGDIAKSLANDAQSFDKLVKGDDLDAAQALLAKLKTEIAAALAIKPNTVAQDDGSSLAPAGDGSGTPNAGKPVDRPAAAPDPKDADAKRRKALLAEYAAMQPDLIKAGASANPGAVKKVQMLSQMFVTELNAGNLDKAAKTLQLLKKTVQSVLKLPMADDKLKTAKDFFGGIGQSLGQDVSELTSSAGEAASDIGDFFGGLAKGISETAHDVVGSLTDADEANKTKIDAYGLSDEQQLVLVHAARNDPAAITAALPVLDKIKTLKLPPAQFENLLALSKSEPKAYAATIAAMANIDATGAIDVSIAATTQSLKNVQAKKKVFREKLNNWDATEAAEKAAKEAYNTAFDAATAAANAEYEAALALQTYQATLPADLTTLSPVEQAAAAAEIARLNGVLGAARTAMTAANAAEAAALTAKNNASAAFVTAQSDYFTAQSALDAAVADNETLLDKRELIDAITFGPLSAEAKSPLSEEDKARVIEAYGKAPDVGQEALELIKKLEDPSLIVANVGAVVDRLDGGFADAKGNKLEITKPDGTKGPPSKAAAEAMAISALKLGSARGQEYFDGFNAYMDSGAQLKKDPCGGTDREPGDRDLNIDAVAQKRSALMADAVIQGNGSVDFDSKNAKSAMDHILYHPGSLQTYSPHAIDEIDKTKKLFADPATKDRANEIIGDTKVAKRSEKQSGRARHIVADTTGKTPRNISHNDAKEAVLSAMMTPLSQGPVGSCFSTGPVRRMKETEPLKVMEKFSGIVNTGTVQAADRTVTDAAGNVTVVPGDIYPANRSAHEGQNPLMRSLEYTIADAGANLAQSQTKNWDTGVVMGDTRPPGQNLSGIETMLDDPTQWAGTRAVDPATGEIDMGIEERIKKAISVKFKYVYNAAPGSKGDSSSGDGRSTDGGYDVFVDGTKIKDRASYVKAMTEIALAALPSGASQVEIDKITAHIASDVFADAVTKANGGDPPWSRGAGYGGDTTSVLRGGNHVDKKFLGKKRPPSTTTDAALERSKVVLESLMGKINAMTGDMEMMRTAGDNAQHAFNAVPGHPSLDKIKGADTSAKIEAELLAPGRVISETKFPAAKAAKIFEKAINAISDKTESTQHDLLALALDKRPTEEMSPKELDAHIDRVSEDFKKAVAKEEADAWKAKKIADGEVVSDADYNLEESRLKKLQDMEVDSATAGVLAAEFDLPEVVVADANWGDATSQIYFVFAPDPATGKLRMWEKNEFDGTMSPADTSWTNAKWLLLEE
ncbi:hypothetical protein OS190_11825 [Sulfitobacter sp. F26204]|uniref:hypothetical protein n=1 Tax=Sulfitobacter sp. F26204 TaxID=2996014 RepID=UPI00225E0F59|nr:hypothetical protein [Sulfitobacter sp. F26204]MCX7560259.1 hypothetical protein [Sulfitobacter sp. F26204]